MQTVTMGLVLHQVKLGEADRILTILSPELGLISASAKGSLRIKSRLFSGCGLFCYSEFSLTAGRNTWFVEEAQPQRVFHGLSRSVEGMALASYLAELTMALPPIPADAGEQLRLLLNSFYLISKGGADLDQIKAVFELRFLSQGGYQPELLCCKGCQKYDGGAFYLNVGTGELLCADCAAREGRAPNLDGGALVALRHICLVEDKKIFSFTLAPGSMANLSRVAERYALHCAGKPLTSLSFWHEMKIPAVPPQQQQGETPEST